MLLTQYYLGCLSHASYLSATTRPAGRGGRPAARRRRVPGRRRGARPAHRAGHRDPLPRRLPLRPPRAGRRPPAPTICYGEARRPAEFPIEPLADGQRLVARRGGARDPGHARAHARVDQHRRVRATPTTPSPSRVLTGDTLFIGDVGRPDLLASRRRRRPTSWPASSTTRCTTSCSRCPTPPGCSPPTAPARPAARTCRPRPVAPSASSGAPTTPSQPMTEDEFVAAVTEGQPAAPPYFAFDADAQPRGPRAARRGPTPPPPLDLDEVRRAPGRRAPSCSTPATAADFAAGHLRGSVNVGLDGRFAEYAGDVVPPEPADRARHRPGQRARGQGPPRPHRLRPRRRRAGRPAAAFARPPRRVVDVAPGSPAASWPSGVSDDGRPRSSSTSATPARPRSAPSPAP